MNDLLAAASLLLTVVSVLYGLWYEEISKAIENARKLPPASLVEDRVAPLKKMRATLYSRAIPLAIASICVALVFLPPSVTIMFHFAHRFCQLGLSIFMKYDAIVASFVLVELFALFLAYLSLARAWKLMQKSR